MLVGWIGDVSWCFGGSAWDGKGVCGGKGIGEVFLLLFSFFGVGNRFGRNESGYVGRGRKIRWRRELGLGLEVYLFQEGRQVGRKGGEERTEHNGDVDEEEDQVYFV